ncbi:lysine-rich coiled-coil protein 1 isoform X1 [Marmota marmota marmota]|nr:lysine-rich coiled-coil protein 1 isoform X1 [Marmota marmota marmota]
MMSSQILAQPHYLKKVHSENLKQLMGKYDQLSPPGSQPEKASPCALRKEPAVCGLRPLKTESLFANLMKHSKSYDSFQDELEDYIKVQKARGLEPKTCFRKMREGYLETCGHREEVDSRARYRMSDQRPPPGLVQTHPRSCSTPQTADGQLPQCLPAQDGRLRPESLSVSQLPKDCFLGTPVPRNLSQREYNCGSYDLESSVHRHLSSGKSLSTRPASHKQAHQKRKRHPEEGGEEAEEEQPKHRRKRGSEELGLGRHRSIQRKKAKVETEATQVSAGKPKSRKERKSRAAASRKEGRKHRKASKDQGQERTEEEMLWDQSILGF